MAYIGIGYSGNDPDFLVKIVDEYKTWIEGERKPKFFGNGFLLLYDSNTSREFVKKCVESAPLNTISAYPIEKPLERNLI